MADKPKTSVRRRKNKFGTSATNLRATAERMLANAKRDGTLKGGSATNAGGLLARLTAVRAKAAAAAQPAVSQTRGATQAATRGSGTNKSPWVKNAQDNKLPSKSYKAASSASQMAADVRRGSPANAKLKKKMTAMPKAKPAKRSTPMPKVREAASSNRYRKPTPKRGSGGARAY